MASRQVLQLGAIVWAAVGLAVGLMSLGSVNADARLLVGAACIAGPLAALMASASLAKHHDSLASVLLLASVITPTFFAWALNIPALVVGLVLIFTPHRVSDHRRLGRG
jgi:hypothetical protein